MPTDVGQDGANRIAVSVPVYGLGFLAKHSMALALNDGNLSDTSLNQEGLPDPALYSRATEAENNCTGGKDGGECQENGGGRDVVCHGGDDPEKN